MESKELKPCPFCGSEAGMDEDDSYGLTYRISCFKGCGDGDLWFKTKDEAVSHWNTRPIEVAQQQTIDGLVEALGEIIEIIKTKQPFIKMYHEDYLAMERAEAALKAAGVEL